jgi:hypothetical protein
MIGTPDRKAIGAIEAGIVDKCWEALENDQTFLRGSNSPLLRLKPKILKLLV